MSTVPLVTVADLPATRRWAPPRQRVWIRASAFTGLCLYGVERWARLLRDPPVGRLLGLVALAVGLAVLVPFARRRLAGAPASVGRLVVGALSAGLILGALPVAGLRLRWVIDLRIAVSARAIGHGLSALGGLLVPYLGHAYPVRLVLMLGVAILLLDAAAALAFAGGEAGALGDGRRAAAALPLIALAVVPSTLVPERRPALQGLILFGLLALFVWGERIDGGRRAAALGLACAAGLAGLVTGPILARGSPWVDYRAWAGPGPGTAALDSFNWNQSYGPLDWPQDGRVVLVVRSHRGDYWKASDLGDFDGTAWIDDPVVASRPALPTPSAAARRRYTETVQVTIDAMRTQDVIGGSGVTDRPQLAGGVSPGGAPGTWVAHRALVPGDTYTVRTYSPSPASASLARASTLAYPWTALEPDLSVTLPVRGGSTSVPFPGFHHGSRLVRETLARSPYAPVYALAQRLAARARTPYAFVRAVKRYLDSGAYRYFQHTRATRYPLIDFLLHSKIGYCQQFSGAMALLLRMGGVPARVAGGFTPGTLNAGGVSWAVADTDAHAWVEVWFPQYGWVRFDPTPASAPARTDSTAFGVEPRLRGKTDGTRSDQLHAEGAAHHRSGSTRVHGSGASATVHGAGAGRPWWLWAGVGGACGLLVVGLGLGLGWYFGVPARPGGEGRRRRGRPAPDALWELERALARSGRPVRGGTTLTALARRFDGSPEAAAYVRALRLERYGAATGPPSAPSRAAGRRAIRAELGAGLGLGGRLRALWALPPRL